jgi:hypothetical protein
VILGRVLLAAIAVASSHGSSFAACADSAAVAATRAAAEQACAAIGAGCSTAKDHGAYVSCIANQAKGAAKAGTLPKSCKGAVVRCAANSTCGKPGFVTCCRTNKHGNTSCVIDPGVARCAAPRHGMACVGSASSCCDACVGSECASATTTTTISQSTTTTTRRPTTTTTVSTTTTARPTTTTSPTTTTTTTSSSTTTTTQPCTATCSAVFPLCGTVSVCGQTLGCGCPGTVTTCGGGGTPGVCGCTSEACIASRAADSAECDVLFDPTAAPITDGSQCGTCGCTGSPFEFITCTQIVGTCLHSLGNGNPPPGNCNTFCHDAVDLSIGQCAGNCPVCYYQPSYCP